MRRLRPKSEPGGWKTRPSEVVVDGGKFGKVVLVEWVDEGPEGARVLYDQILRAEPGGGTCLPIDAQGRIGLVRHGIRPQARDIDRWKREWAEGKCLDYENLGRLSYEAPRGFAEIGESGEETSRREGSEETRSRVTASHSVGYGCENTAMVPHLTHHAAIVVDQTVEVEGDPNERLIGQLEWFTYEELQFMVEQGQVYCDMTMALIGRLLMLRPELLNLEFKYRQ